MNDEEEVDDFEEVPYFLPNKQVSQSSDTCSLSHSDSDSHDSITSKNSPKRRKRGKYISFYS
jgi:hypothetical protein